MCRVVIYAGKGVRPDGVLRSMTSSWKKFIPYEVSPIIAAMGIVFSMATYRLIRAANLPDVKFTRFGGLHSWQDKLEEHEEKSSNNK